MQELKPNLLIVDDEPELLALYTESFELLGLGVVPARDGEEAWRLFSAREGAFQLVISDIFMPRLNGIELLNRIKRSHPHIPVLLISGYEHRREMVSQSPIQPDEYLEKPFELETLFEAVQRLLPAGL